MLTGIIVYPVAVAFAVLVVWRAARSGQPAFVVAMRALFVLYLGWVAGATLFPLPVRQAVVELEAAGAGVTVGLTPLATIRVVLLRGTPFTQAWILGGNVLTLAPFGFLLPFSAPRVATWPRVAAAALLFPLAIELSQLAVSMAIGYSYRATEVDDVLLNFAGVLLGFAVFAAVRGRVSLPRETRGHLERVRRPAPHPPGDHECRRQDHLDEREDLLEGIGPRDGVDTDQEEGHACGRGQQRPEQPDGQQAATRACEDPHGGDRGGGGAGQPRQEERIGQTAPADGR